MALFECYERRIEPDHSGAGKVRHRLPRRGQEALSMPRASMSYDIVKEIQPIAFENACWAYIVGAAIAIKKGQKKAADIAATLGEGLQAFCIPGSVADDRKVGIGHGNLASMLLQEETKCFAFLGRP